MNVFENLAYELELPTLLVVEGGSFVVKFKRNQKVCGIYGAVCSVTGKCYVGSSTDISNRITSHIRLLRNGNHHSPVFQNHVNKYGTENLKWYILEEVVNENSLYETEQHYLDYLKSYDKEYGFNIARHARFQNFMPRQDKTKKYYPKVFSLKDPMGRVYHANCSYNKFSREHKSISSASVSNLVRKRETFIMGWCLEETEQKMWSVYDPSGNKYDFCDIPFFHKHLNGELSLNEIRNLVSGHVNSKGWSLVNDIRCLSTLVDPEGVFHNFTEIKSFADQHGLLERYVSDLVKGIKKHYKGWTVPGFSIPEKPERELLSPSGEIHKFRNVDEFALANGLLGSGVSCVLNGHERSHRGWRRVGDIPVVREWVFIHKDGTIEKTGNMSAMARKYGISERNLSAVSRGKHLTACGWSLHSINYK